MALKNEINWLLTCRICLKSSESEMKYIFSKSSFSDDIVERIIKCGGIPVDVMDGMPDRICNQCLLDLDTANKFRNTCQQSYYQLYQILNSKEDTRKPCEDYAFEECNPKEEHEKQDDEHISLFLETKSDFLRKSSESLYISEEELFEEGFKQEIEEEETEVQSNHLEYQILNADTQPPKAKGQTLRANAKNGIPKISQGRPTNPAASYICYCCGNLYKTKSKLSQHIKLHSAEKPHECEICKKKFAQTAQLSRHMNSHTGNRPYKCKYCSSSFADPSTCIKHERIHTNSRPFKCMECGKSFAYSNVLKVHQKIHTGEKPFSCSVCDKKFTQKHHKKSHERTHSNFSRAVGESTKSHCYSNEI